MYTHYPMNAQPTYMQQANIYGNPYQQRLEALTQQQAQQQSPQSNAQFIMVDGIEAARNTAVMPGQIRWMMNNDGSVMYVKAVDMTGAVAMRVLNLVEVTPDMQQKPGKEYAPMDRLIEIEHRIDALEQKGTTE